MLLVVIALGLGLLGFSLGFWPTKVAKRDKGKAWIRGGIGAFIGLIVLPIVISVVAGVYTDFWLYQSMKLEEIFLRRLGLYWMLFGIGFSIAGIFLLANLAVAAKIIPEKMSMWWKLIAGVLIVAASLIFGAAAAGAWDEILLWKNQVPFGKMDPLFGRDIGWYVFSYPFLSMIIGWGFWLITITTGITSLVYLAQAIDYRHDYERRTWGDRRTTKGLENERRIYGVLVSHLGVLAALLAVVLVFYWILRRMALPIDAYSVAGYAGSKIAGAAWVDSNFVYGAMAILPWLSTAIAIGCLWAAFAKKWKLLVGVIGTKVAYVVLIMWIAPLLVWSFGVRPTELSKESSYIKWSNENTLEAFGLGKGSLSVQTFPANPLTAEDIVNAPAGVFENLRLLDPFEVAIRSFDQEEEQRRYYDFQDPDIDVYRYPDGCIVQVVVGARELPEAEIPTSTWVNDHLVFTHGLGAAMAQVNKFDASGNMTYLVRGIPGKGPFVPKQEAIYYGEASGQWIATGTTEKEVGTPLSSGGWEEVEYNGEGGVLLGSGLRRFTFALRFNDFTLLLTNRLRPETRIHLVRNIQERVSAIAPFLWLDDDPYIIAGTERFQWMWDGATWAKNYPYADPQLVSTGFNIRYVRPSVKITMDAYSGIPTFYEVDKNDPVLQTWKRIFPTLFKPLAEMAEELKPHIRYPEQVFILQARTLMYQHMSDPTARYNGEDMWEIAKEHSLGKIQETAPRYVITVLPGQEEPEYILDWTFVRQNKQNGVAFLAARSNPENYGKLELYSYPVGKMIIGPAQIEDLIDQDSTLGPQITLLSSQGKEVVRGNLMALPLRESMLYVKPIYVRATTEGGGQGLPQLRYVVVGSTERKIAFGKTLDEALQSFVREEVVPESTEQPATPSTGETASCNELWKAMRAAVESKNAEEIGHLALKILAANCK